MEIQSSPSIFFKGMEGSRLPIAIAHGEGRVASTEAPACMYYVDNYGGMTEKYPLNPNGSVDGATAFTTTDGRVTIMMPHPERVFRTVQNSWHPSEWSEDGPWMKMFQNARDFAGE